MEKKVYFKNVDQLKRINTLWGKVCDLASAFVTEHKRLGMGNVSQSELNAVINWCKPYSTVGRQERVRELFVKKYKECAIKTLYLNNVAPALHERIVSETTQKDLGQLGVIGAQLQTLVENQEHSIFNFERAVIDYKENRLSLPESELKKNEEYCSVFIENERQQMLADLLETASTALTEIHKLSGQGNFIVPNMIYLEGNEFHINPLSLKTIR